MKTCYMIAFFFGRVCECVCVRVHGGLTSLNQSLLQVKKQLCLYLGKDLLVITRNHKLALEPFRYDSFLARIVEVKVGMYVPALPLSSSTRRL